MKNTFPIIALLLLVALVIYATSNKNDWWGDLPWKSPVSIEGELENLT